MATSLRRGSFSSLAAVVLGIPLGVVAVIVCLQDGVLPTEYRRYLEHPVEHAELVLFCCGVIALGVKLISWFRERWAGSQELLPAWDGKTVSASEAGKLRGYLDSRWGLAQKTWLGQRIRAVLDFVHSRQSASQLDDQLRTLSDNDAMTLDGSYSFVRFINWAIPILGFLGTVVGITAAVANVTPETLEENLSNVTGGLATAFDTTALALCLTMVLMFTSFLVERLENGMLQAVDAWIDAELAHRFERAGPEASPVVEALRVNSQQMLRTTEQLIDKQVTLWSRSLEKAERHWHDAGHKQIEQTTAALQHALDAALARHAQHLRQAEEQFLGRTQALLAGLTLAADKMAEKAAALTQLQQEEAQLVRLQETLQQNLAALAGAGAFEEAVQSLTAAIHLLTARTQPTIKKSLAA